MLVVTAPAMDIVSGLIIALMTVTTVAITAITIQTVRIFFVFDNFFTPFKIELSCFLYLFKIKQLLKFLV